MKKAGILSSFILMSFLSIAQVQRVTAPVNSNDSAVKSTSSGKANMDRRKMMRELDLTQEQKGKIKEIHLAGKAKKEAIENDTRLSDPEKQMQLRALQKEQAQSTMKILNEQQQEKMKAARLQMRQKGQPKNDELN